MACQTHLGPPARSLTSSHSPHLDQFVHRSPCHLSLVEDQARYVCCHSIVCLSASTRLSQWLSCARDANELELFVCEPAWKRCQRGSTQVGQTSLSSMFVASQRTLPLSISRPSSSLLQREMYSLHLNPRFTSMEARIVTRIFA
jgi:hypothetical protein